MKFVSEIFNYHQILSAIASAVVCAMKLVNSIARCRHVPV